MKWAVLGCLLLAGCASQDNAVYLERERLVEGKKLLDQIKCEPASTAGVLKVGAILFSHNPAEQINGADEPQRRCVIDFELAGYRRIMPPAK